MSCSITSDCLTATKGVYTSNKCNDPNNSCFCVKGQCTTGTCSSDSYCKSTFGDGFQCAGIDPTTGLGSCTDNICSTTSDCPPFMHCNGSACVSNTCNGKSDCGMFGQCVNGYCTRMTFPSPFWVFILVLVAILAAFVGYRVYGHYKQ